MKKKVKRIKPQNIMAMELATPKYKMKVVESKKLYKRVKELKDQYENKVILFYFHFTLFSY
jgi:hypothetical protein